MFEQALRLQDMAVRIGMAVWHCQELETALSTYLVVCVQPKPGIGMTKGSALTANAESKPMGVLLKELNKAGVVPHARAVRLNAALEERNWMVHRISRQHRGVLHKDAVYTEVIERIDALAAEALALQKATGKEVESYVSTHGLSRAYVDREAAKLLSKWHPISKAKPQPNPRLLLTPPKRLGWRRCGNIAKDGDSLGRHRSRSAGR